MTKEIEAKKVMGLKRMTIKLLHAISKSALLSGKMRVRLHKWRGVNFTDAKTNFIGEDVIIDTIYPQNVFIGKGTMITAGCKIITHFIDTEKRSSNENLYFRFYQGKVIIEENVFIGMNCVISKPVTIGAGAVIGANTVITKDVPPGAIIVSSVAINLKDSKAE